MKKALAIFICAVLLLTVLAIEPTTAAGAVKTGKTAEKWAKELGVPTESIVMPSGSTAGTIDRQKARAAQAACNQITFLPGFTYYLDSCIYSTSGLRMIANGATIIMTKRTGIIWDKDKGKPGYIPMNIYIEGGYWKVMANKQPRKITIMQFIHSQGVTLKNMRVVTDFAMHIVELIAVKDVLIDGCTFEMAAKHYYPDDKNEAIQIDFASGGANATSAYPDKAACSNVTITNNKLKFFRGVGTNVNAGKKEYKVTYKKITISGNTITSAKGEGIYATNIKNLTAKNNIFYGNISKPALATRKLSGTTAAPLAVKRATVNTLKKGATVVKGTKDKAGKITVTINGKKYSYNKSGTTYSVKVPKLAKGASVSIKQLCGQGNEFRITVNVK